MLQARDGSRQMMQRGQGRLAKQSAMREEKSASAVSQGQFQSIQSRRVIYTSWESSLQHGFRILAANESFATSLHRSSPLLPTPLLASWPGSEPSLSLEASKVPSERDSKPLTPARSEADVPLCRWQMSLWCNGSEKCHRDLPNTTHTHTHSTSCSH